MNCHHAFNHTYCLSIIASVIGSVATMLHEKLPTCERFIPVPYILLFCNRSAVAIIAENEEGCTYFISQVLEALLLLLMGHCTNEYCVLIGTMRYTCFFPQSSNASLTLDGYSSTGFHRKLKSPQPVYFISLCLSLIPTAHALPLT